MAEKEEKVTQEWLEKNPESVLKIGDLIPINAKRMVEVKPGQTVVDADVLTNILKKQAEQDIELENMKAKNAGMEELWEAEKGVSPTGEKKLRERKSYEPAFRTVKLRKYPIGGDVEKLGYVIGWTNRGAYEKVDRSGISPVVINYLDIVFLDELTMEAKRTLVDGKDVVLAEAVPIKDLLNQGIPVNCKIIERRMNTRKVPTGEEINVTMWDPAHGLMQTGEVIDGYVAVTDLEYVIQIPGLIKQLTIDGKYVN